MKLELNISKIRLLRKTYGGDQLTIEVPNADAKRFLGTFFKAEDGFYLSVIVPRSMGAAVLSRMFPRGTPYEILDLTTSTEWVFRKVGEDAE